MTGRARKMAGARNREAPPHSSKTTLCPCAKPDLGRLLFLEPLKHYGFPSNKRSCSPRRHTVVHDHRGFRDRASNEAADRDLRRQRAPNHEGRWATHQFTGAPVGEMTGRDHRRTVRRCRSYRRDFRGRHMRVHDGNAPARSERTIDLSRRRRRRVTHSVPEFQRHPLRFAADDVHLVTTSAELIRNERDVPLYACESVAPHSVHDLELFRHARVGGSEPELPRIPTATGGNRDADAKTQRCSDEGSGTHDGPPAARRTTSVRTARPTRRSIVLR